MQTKRTSADALLSTAAGWLTRFEQHDVKYVVLDPDEDRSLIQLLQTRSEWTLDFWEPPAQGQPALVLFVRSDVLHSQAT